MPRITLTAPYTDGDGKTHKADSTVDVDRGVASDLKFHGRARDPETKKATDATPAATKEKS